jgi:hypothetical protein
MGRQFAAVSGKQCSVDQSQGVPLRQYLRNKLFDRFSLAGDKVGDGVVIGLCVTGQGLYSAIGFAAIYEGSAGDTSPGIALAAYGEHDRGRISGSALVVVVERGVEEDQIKVIDEVLQGEIQKAGYDLFLKRNDKEQSLKSIKICIPSHSSHHIP